MIISYFYFLFQLTYSSLAEWTGLPICWLLCHWLAMSHSCYNPIIYCYMNARFRIGFLQALGKIPCFRKYLPPEVQRPRSSMTGFALTGKELHFYHKVGDLCNHTIEKFFRRYTRNEY